MATKISFINEIAHLCEEVGASVEDVAKGIGLDPRIGKDFCAQDSVGEEVVFPKDVLALSKLAASLNYPFANRERGDQNKCAYDENASFQSVGESAWYVCRKKIAVLGLAFKDNTDDTRESAAVAIIRELHNRGAEVRAYDPIAKVTSEHVGFDLEHSIDPYSAAEGAEAVVIATEWDEFRNLDLPRLRKAMNGEILFDGRNLLSQEEAERCGFRYLRVGRKSKT